MLTRVFNRKTLWNFTVPENIENLVPNRPWSPIFSGTVEFNRV